jgi:hypothetical protein
MIEECEKMKEKETCWRRVTTLDYLLKLVPYIFLGFIALSAFIASNTIKSRLEDYDVKMQVQEYESNRILSSLNDYKSSPSYYSLQLGQLNN